ncbi:MAG TPA: IS3 family transposase [Solirubrobacteraceae bacterium]|nr:IS3 family transposase [Solirubrobacteraceae bacterium]
MKVFGFVLSRKAEHSIALMCRVLEVARSGYHAWAARPMSARGVEDARLTARIRELHDKRRKVYGSPRIWADLVVDDGERIGRKRVERLMRQAGLSGLISRKYKATTIRVPGVRVADDLLDRDFAAGAPNRCWVADITYLRTWDGWLYLVAVQDLYSRRIVGWSMADHMRTELVTDALQMALARRRPGRGLIWHSDQGSQGGCNWSSQRLDRGDCDGQAGWLDEGADGQVADEVAGQAVASARCRASVLAADRRGLEQRRRGAVGRGVDGGWCPMVSGAWRDGDVHARAGLVPVFVL